jgi:hypothetical protein
LGHRPLSLSVCIPTLDDVRQVDRLVNAVSPEGLPDGITLRELVIVSPRRELAQVVESLRRRRIPARLLLEERPRGKAAALRTALSVMSGDMVLIANGDVTPERRALGELLRPFVLWGSRAVAFSRPAVPRRNLMHRLSALLWDIHDRYIQWRGHERAHLPGEFFVLPRALLLRLPLDAVNDDAFLLRAARSLGLRPFYVRSAKVFPKPAANVASLFLQRLRINRGHLWDFPATAREPPGVLLGVLVSPISALGFLGCVVRAVTSKEDLPALLLLGVVEALALLCAFAMTLLGLRQPLPWRGEWRSAPHKDAEEMASQRVEGLRAPEAPI